MYEEADFKNLVSQTFRKHGVTNEPLEKAITEILDNALDTRELSRRIWEEVNELTELNRRRTDSFR